MTREYITKELASKRSGKSVRRLQELAAAGTIRKHIISDRKTKRTLALYHADDIEALSRGLLPAQIPALRGAITPRGSAWGAPQPLWLTLAEAADYSGLPASFLVRLIEGGKLPALDVGPRPGGHWRVSRRDLEAIRGNTTNVA